MPPLAERGDKMRWLTPAEAAATKARTGIARGDGDSGTNDDNTGGEGQGATGMTSASGLPGTARQRGGVGGLLLNCAPTQTTLGTIQGSGDGTIEKAAATPTRRPRDAASALLAATNGRPPTQTGQCVVNNDMR